MKPLLLKEMDFIIPKTLTNLILVQFSLCMRMDKRKKKGL